jgi:hypothetical protein
MTLSANAGVKAGVALEGNAGLEFGIAFSPLSGQRMCYVGGCVGAAAGAGASLEAKVSAGAGVAITLLKDGSNIAGTANTVGIYGKVSLSAGVGGAVGGNIDLVYPDFLEGDPTNFKWEYFKPFDGDFWKIFGKVFAVSFSPDLEVSAGVGGSVELGFGAGTCWCPLCISESGGGCGEIHPTMPNYLVELGADKHYSDADCNGATPEEVLEKAHEKPKPTGKPALCRVKKITGKFPADKGKHRLATKAQAKGKAALLGKWEVCMLSDGQIDGPGHGGQVEDSKQKGYDCALACMGGVLKKKPTSAATAMPLKTVYNEKCADIHYGHGGNLYMHDCHYASNQQFYLEKATPPTRIKTKSGNKCLDYNYNNGNLYFHNCHSGKNQLFFFRDGDKATVPLERSKARRIGTLHDGKCIDYHPGNNNLYMHDCHRGTNQKFYLEAPKQDLERETVMHSIATDGEEKASTKNMPCEPAFATNLGWLNAAFETADLERSGTRRDPYGMAMEAMDEVARKKALRPPRTDAEIVLERAAAEQLWIESMERDMEAGVAANIPLPDLEMEARNDVRMWGTKGFPEGKAWYEFNSVEAQNYMLRREKIFQRHADLERTSKLPDLEQAHKVEAVERALEAVEEQMDVLQEEA